MKNPKVADLLFEIGTEELPAAYLPGLIDQLDHEARTLLQEQHLPFQSLRTMGTPRRLVLHVQELASIQQKPSEEVRGPSKRAAYDGKGTPTPALLGFIRSHHASLTQTTLVSSEKGEYVYLVKPPTTTPTTRVLPTLLPHLITRLRAPKTMRWDATGVRFARPIRWLGAWYGSTLIRYTFGMLTSQPNTWVGLPKHPRRVPITSVAGYLKTPGRVGIMLDHQIRRAWIEREVARIAKRARGSIAPEMISHGLLDEVTFLVEEPITLEGAFDPKYLHLPREVLLASMAKYQRVFAIEGAGKVLPKFVAILEGKPKQPAAVRVIIERILNARLADSLMFWVDDHKIPLHQQNLSGVTFHEKLGSMEEKTQRLYKLSSVLAEQWQLSAEERGHVQRACLLAKADLPTTMVKEFPTLQGVVGKYYARDAGEPEPVAQALEEHYLPLGNRLPTTLIGSALAILDKYDMLASYFSVGIEPTGDQDPFGLRRAAQGIVEVGWAVRRPLFLKSLFAAWQPLAPFAQGKDQTGHRVQQYLLERLYTFAWPKPVPSTDCIEAVLGSPCDDLIDVMERVISLQRLTGHPGLLKAAKVIERTKNILKGASLHQSQVNPDKLQEPIEQQLWELYRSNEHRVVSLAQRKSYAEATTLFGDLFFEPLHDFFGRVMVNVPDEALQQNRLALMKAIHTLYTERIADLSKLTVLQQQREESER